MTYLIVAGLIMFLVVLIANRNLSSLRQEPTQRWHEASQQDYVSIPSFRAAFRYKFRLLKGMDTVILVWGARALTPLLLIGYSSVLIEDHMSRLGESWSIALQFCLMICGAVFSYFVMPAPIPYRRHTRNMLLTILSIGLGILLGLWNALGISAHFAMVRSQEIEVKWEAHRAIAPQ
jgi:hypothetical protein